MRAAWRHGWRFVSDSWRLIASAFLMNLGAGVLALWLLSSWLAGVLDAGLPTRSLLTNLDPQVWLDIAANHAAEVAALTQQLVLLGIAALLFFVWINGALAAAVGGRGTSVGSHYRVAAAVYPRLLGLALCVWSLQLCVVVSIGLLARSAVHWWGDGSSELTLLATWGVGLVSGMLATAALTLLHDHARLRIVKTQSKPMAALRWSLGFLRHRGVQAAVMLGLFAGLGVALSVLHLALSEQLPTTSTLTGTVSLLLGQLVLAVRMTLRAALYGADWRLQAQFER